MGYSEGLFTWCDIALPDPQAGTEFYTALFGWTPGDAHDEDGNYVYTMLYLGNEPVAGLGPQPPGMGGAGIPPMWTSYVTVDDLNTAVSRWRDAGGTIVMAPMDISDSGKMAIGADPEGALLAFWHPGTHAGATVFNQPGAMTWNELNTRDSATARSFYEKALGWEYEEMTGPGEYWVIRVPGKQQGLPLSDDPYNGGIMTIGEDWSPDIPAYWAIYFHTADVDDTVARAVDLGGSVIVAAFDSSAGRMAVIADPQGGTFSVIAPTPPA